MKKKVFGRKLKRDMNERTALFKSLMSSFILKEKVQTTESKAKAIKPEIEKLVTKAKEGSESANKVLQKSLSRPAFEKILKDIAPRFSNRQGGYTRLIKLGKRFGDDAPMALMEWVEKAKENLVEEKSKEKIKKKLSIVKSVSGAKVIKFKSVKNPVKKTREKTAKRNLKNNETN